MEMFLIGACLCLLGVTVSAVMFAAATRDEQPNEPRTVQPRVALNAPRFFADNVVTAAPRFVIPAEVLLMQLERHIRLEQAAAESFHAQPDVRSLHSRTTSPLVH